MCIITQRPMEVRGRGSLGVGVTDSCEQLGVDAGTQNSGPVKSCKRI